MVRAAIALVGLALGLFSLMMLLAALKSKTQSDAAAGLARVKASGDRALQFLLPLIGILAGSALLCDAARVGNLSASLSGPSLEQSHPSQSH